MQRFPEKTETSIGPGQYRNAVASGRSQAYDISYEHIGIVDQTRPRYGTDPVQVPGITSAANPKLQR